MAVNRYDAPIDAQFINTYTPIPFDQMVQAGALKQQRYDQSTARFDAKLAGIEAVPTAPNSVDEKRKQEVLRQLNDLAIQYSNKDLSNAMVGRQFDNQIRSIASSRELEGWAKTAEGWANYQKEAARLEALNKGTHPFLRKDITGWDSRGEIFNELPTAGEDWKDATRRFFMDVNPVSSNVKDVGDGYKGIVKSVDLNRLVEYANLNKHTFARTAAGREMVKVARTQGDDRSAEDIVYDWLLSEAPTHISRDVQVIAGSGSNKTTLPRRFYGEVEGSGVVQNENLRSVNQKIIDYTNTLDSEEFRLRNMIQNNASPEKIAIQEKRVLNTKEKVDELEGRLNKLRTQVDSEISSKLVDINNDYLNKIQKVAGVSAKEAQRYIDIARYTVGDVLSSMRDVEVPPTAMGALSLADDPVLNKLDNKTKKVLASYIQEASQFTNTADKKLNEAVAKEFSQTVTAKEIVLPQKKETNGVYTFQGIDGQSFESLIDPQVTDPLMDNPKRFKISSNIESLNKKNDKLEEYIRLAGEGKEDYKFELSSIDKVVRPDGSLRLNYSLSGKDLDSDTYVYVDIDDDEQVENILTQLAFSGAPPRKLEELALGRYWMPKAEEEGAGTYDLHTVSDKDGQPLKTNVKYENGKYNIYLIDDKTKQESLIKSASNRQELGVLLTQLDIEVQQEAMINLAAQQQ